MNFYQFKNKRIDLDGIGAFEVREQHENRYSHYINLYPRGKTGDYFQISFKFEDRHEFKETVKFLDEFFATKTEEERKIFP